MDNINIEVRENKLLKKEKRYRVLRDVVFVLAFLIFIGLISSFFFEYKSEFMSGKYDSSLFWTIIFFFLVANNCRARLQHIESIKSYRSKRDQEVEGQALNSD